MYLFLVLRSWGPLNECKHPIYCSGEHFQTTYTFKNRQTMIKVATELIWANMVLYNKNKVGMSHTWTWRGLELLSCGLCLCLREKVSSCTEVAIVAGPVQRRGEEVMTHISSQYCTPVITQHEPTWTTYILLLWWHTTQQLGWSNIDNTASTHLRGGPISTGSRSTQLTGCLCQLR